MQSIQSFYRPDAQGDQFHVVHTQDVAPVLKSVEYLKQQREKVGDAEFGKHVARIPLVFLKKWGKEDGINNDPEYKKLRVWDGHMGIEDTN
jgi:hypothetical protein